jgi:hypothetical protein
MSTYEPYLFTLDKGKSLVDHIKHYSQHNLHNVKKIINVFQPYYKHTKGPGLGDFMRGCYFLYQYCKIANKECEINLKYHLISNMLENEYSDISSTNQHSIELCYEINFHTDIYDKHDVSPYMSSIQSIHSYLSKCHIDDQQTMYVYFSSYPLFIIDDDTRLFIKKSFTPSHMINNMVSSMLEEKQLEYHTYHIIHIRCGDSYLINNNTPQSQCISSIVSTIKNYMNSRNKYLLIADSNILKETILSYLPELIIYDYVIAHTGEGVDQQIDGIIGTMIDYIFLSKSLSIFSISTYEHGSGFSKWCAETYAIPYRCSYLKILS